MKKHYKFEIRPGDLCECGRHADRIVQREKICNRCYELQKYHNAYWARKPMTGLRDDRKGGSELYDERWSFVSKVVDAINETIVVGHGEYHLKAA